jgi:hypothetical protein
MDFARLLTNLWAHTLPRGRGSLSKAVISRVRRGIDRVEVAEGIGTPVSPVRFNIASGWTVSQGPAEAVLVFSTNVHHPLSPEHEQTSSLLLLPPLCLTLTQLPPARRQPISNSSSTMP